MPSLNLFLSYGSIFDNLDMTDHNFILAKQIA
jgi:hypothetical protein